MAVSAFTQISTNSKAELSDIDFSITDVEFPNYLYKDSTAILRGSFENKGVKPIESIDITYQVGDNGYVETYTLDNIHVETGDELEFHHNIPVTLSNAGEYTLTVLLTNPNGIADTTRTNSINFAVIDKSNEYIRKVLVEEFSTEKCPNCPAVGRYLSGIVKANENVILMTHHTGYYFDDYTIDESVELKVFYNGSTWAPAAMMDRHYNGKENDYTNKVNPGPVFWPGNPYGGRRIDDRLSQLSYVDVNIDGVYNDDTRELTVNINGVFRNDINDQVGLSVWIIEDGIISDQQAGALGSDYEHHGVARAVLSETFGDTIKTSTISGQSYSANYQYTLPTDFVDRNISVIAFVNYINDSVNNRSILNANQFELSSLMDQYKTTFTVTDKNNQPVVYATLTIDDDATYTTDGSGNVELYLLEETYSYDIEKYGYEKASGEFSIVDKDVVVNEELVSKIKTTFKISDNASNAIARAAVKIVNVPTQVTDNDGETAFMLSPKTYTYTIENDGYDDISGEFTLANEDTIIEIVFVETYNVTFNVTAVDETPVDSAVITIEGGNTYVTDISGEITFSLDVATYNYTVEKEGYITVSGEFTLESNDKTIDINLAYVSNIQSEENLLNVYPNPFSNELIIEGIADKNAQVIVYDITGKVHRSVAVCESKTVIPTANLAEGVYFIQIVNNNKQSTFKVIK